MILKISMLCGLALMTGKAAWDFGEVIRNADIISYLISEPHRLVCAAIFAVMFGTVVMAFSRWYLLR